MVGVLLRGAGVERVDFFGGSVRGARPAAGRRAGPGLGARLSEGLVLRGVVGDVRGPVAVDKVVHQRRAVDGDQLELLLGVDLGHAELLEALVT